MRLVLACLVLYPGFFAIAFAASSTTMVSRCYHRYMRCNVTSHISMVLQTANAGLRKPGYEANNFRVSCHGGSVASGFLALFDGS